MNFTKKEGYVMLQHNIVLENQHSLFDSHGRRIPPNTNASVHVKTRRRFTISQPEINYQKIYQRINTHLGCNSCISSADFEQRAKQILDNVKGYEASKNIVNSVYVPFFLPQESPQLLSNIGQALETKYIDAVKRSFEESLHDYKFTNHHKPLLSSTLNVDTNSRHGRLIDAMKKEPVVGLYFVSLSEYSIPAAIEQVGSLPEQFLLAGGFDTCAALIGSPELLLKNNGYPPLLWLAALTGQVPTEGYHFEAYGYNLTFNRRLHFNEIAEYWTSALVVIG